jgi:hypothetical protein
MEKKTILQKGLKTSEAVQILAFRKPFIITSIISKTINYTKTAEYLLPEIEHLISEKPTIPAINMALRRFAQQYLLNLPQINKEHPIESPSLIQNILTNYEISIKNDLWFFKIPTDIYTKTCNEICKLTQAYNSFFNNGFSVNIDGQWTLIFAQKTIGIEYQRILNSQQFLINEQVSFIKLTSPANSLSVGQMLAEISPHLVFYQEDILFISVLDTTITLYVSRDKVLSLVQCLQEEKNPGSQAASPGSAASNK